MAQKKTKNNDLPTLVYRRLGVGRPSHKKGARTPFGIWTQGKDGLAGRIEIDPRQSPYEMLDTICHEVMHEAQPEITEDGIERISRLLSRVLWQEGYRRVENDQSEDLTDK